MATRTLRFARGSLGHGPQRRDGPPLPPNPERAAGASSPQRVNAGRLPASTFTMLPVDFAERSEAKKNTASAMSSGRTLRLSRLRLR